MHGLLPFGGEWRPSLLWASVLDAPRIRGGPAARRGRRPLRAETLSSKPGGRAGLTASSRQGLLREAPSPLQEVLAPLEIDFGRRQALLDFILRFLVRRS